MKASFQPAFQGLAAELRSFSTVEEHGNGCRCPCAISEQGQLEPRRTRTSYDSPVLARRNDPPRIFVGPGFRTNGSNNDRFVWRDLSSWRTNQGWGGSDNGPTDAAIKSQAKTHVLANRRGHRNAWHTPKRRSIVPLQERSRWSAWALRGGTGLGRLPRFDLAISGHIYAHAALDLHTAKTATSAHGTRRARRALARLCIWKTRETKAQ